MLYWIAKIILWIGFALATLAAGYWVYFIWTVDWGPLRGRRWGLLYIFVLPVGIILVWTVVAAIFKWISDLYDPDA